ncbi:MAG: putative Ig domain-containing protein, partial [Planctomycetaceae bacterium]|nr:putative Ig domain-containing protein [Planctomycetaceae bacterium]
MESLEPREMLSGVGFDSSEDAIEGVRDGYFRIERTDTTGELTVGFTIDSLGHGYSLIEIAVNGLDFEFLSGTTTDGLNGSITFVDGEQFVDLVVSPINNSLPEPTKLLRISLIPPTDTSTYTINAERASATLNIIDDDVNPQVEINEVINAQEGGESGKFILTRSDTAQELTVGFGVYANTASQTDFSVLGSANWQQFYDSISGTYRYGYVGTVTFVAGQDTVEIVIFANNDSIVEQSETLELFLTDAPVVNGVSQYTLSESTRRAIMPIIDDEISAEVAISEVINAQEGGESGKFILTRSDTAKELTVGFGVYANTASQTDFSVLGTSIWQQFYDSVSGTYRYGYVGTVTFAAGQDTVEIVVVSNNDSIAEYTETLEIFLVDAPVINGVSQYIVTESTRRASMQVIDNDTSFVWIDSVIDAVEGVRDGQIILKRLNTDNQVTVGYRLDDSVSTATRNNDFSNLTGTAGNSRSGKITFEQGSDKAIIVVPVIDDFQIETLESVVVTLTPESVSGSNLPSYSLDSERNVATVLIHDNDVKSTVWIDSSQDGTEDIENGYIRIYRDNADSSLRVSYEIDVLSTAVIGTDYEYLPGTNSNQTKRGFVTFAKGVSFVDIPIRVIDNSLLDGTRTISVTIIHGDETVGGVNTIYDIDESRNTAKVSIFDDDVKTVLRIGEIKNAVEGGDNGYIRVDRDNSRAELTFNFILDSIGSTAVMGKDFTQLSGMQAGSTFGAFTFKVGESSVYIPINVLDNTQIEKDKTIRIILTTGNGKYELDESFEAIVTIKDNDRPTTIFVETIQHGVEGEQDAFIRLRRGNTEEPLTVSFEYDANASTAILGKDFDKLPGMIYGQNTGNITFGIGEEYVDITIKLINDNLVEPDKNILIRLHQGDADSANSYFIIGELNVTINISDSDSITQVWIGEIVNPLEGETGYVRIFRNNNSGSLDVKFKFDNSKATATLNADFKFGGIFDLASQTGTISFADGQNYVDLPIFGLIDRVLENDEILPMTLLESNNGNYKIVGNNSATINILDAGDEDNTSQCWRVGVFASDGFASENNQNTGEFVIVRAGSTDLTQPLTIFFEISGSASSNLDFSGVDAEYNSANDTWYGSLTFQSGQTHITLSITPLVDEFDEGTETVVLTILSANDSSYAIDNANSATIQIEDKTIIDTSSEPGVVVKHTQQIGVVAADAFASENAVNAGEFVISRSDSDDISQPLTVDFEVSGTAILGVDYIGIDAVYDSQTNMYRGSITFQAGQKQYGLIVSPIADADQEIIETIILTLLPTNETDNDGNPIYTLAQNSAAAIQLEDSVKIIDPDSPPSLVALIPTINVTINDQYASEDGNNSGEFAISRSATDDLSQPVTVYFEISGTAVLNTDYTGVNAALDSETGKYLGNITLQAGQRQAIIKITPSKDSLTELTETVVLTLTNSDGFYKIGSDSAAEIKITDAANIYEQVAEPVSNNVWNLSVTATDAFASETNLNSGEFKILRSGLSDLSQTLTVYFEIFGTANPNIDYNGITLTWNPYTCKYSGSATFQAGQSEIILDVNPLRDYQHESTEIVVLTLNNTTEKTSTGEAVYNIDTNNNSATINIENETCAPQGTPTISGDPEMREGGQYKLELNSNDVNVLRWEINWGDGINETIDGTATSATHFFADGDEVYNIAVKAVEEIIIPPTDLGTEGFSVNYWKSHSDDWQIDLNANYESFFNVPAYVPAGTLSDAINCNDKAYDYYGNTVKELWRESVAAILNASHPNIEYKYSLQEIKEMVQMAYWSGQYAMYAAILKSENSRGGNIHTGRAGEQRQEKITNLQKTLCIKNVAPTLRISGESRSVAGAEYLLQLFSADVGNDTITSWTINWGDGTQSSIKSGVTSVSHTYKNGGNFKISATATDEDGTWHSNNLDVQISVTENGIAKGTPWVSGDPEIFEGRTYILDLHNNNADILRWEINWGDGSAIETVDGTATNATHLYADGDATFEISIAAVKSVTKNSSSNQGEGLTYSYWKQYPSNWCFYQSNDYYTSIFGLQNYNNFQSPGSLMQSLKSAGNDPLSEFWRESTAALLNVSHWGVNYCYSYNNVVSFVQLAYSTGQFDYYANLFKTANCYGGKISSGQKSEVEINLTKTITVRNIAPELIISGSTESVPGAVYVLNLDSIDPGIDTITSWEIDWGNGQKTIVEGNPPQTSFVYDNVGEYTITATATDEDGTWRANSVTINVVIPPIRILVKTPWVSGDPEVLEGREYTLDLHKNDADILRWEIDWGDGSEKQVVDISVAQITHIYADGDNKFTITVNAIKEQLIPRNDTSNIAEGFSADYWKTNLTQWTIFNPADSFEITFGVYSCWSAGTLLNALNSVDNPSDWYGNGIKALWRESAAALLNASNPNVNFKYSVDEIIWKIRTAYATGMYQFYADCLHIENNRGGDIVNGNQTPNQIEELAIELTKEIVVRNVAPELVISGNAATKPDEEYSLQLSSSDPGEDTITSWTIDWGDGTQSVVEGNPQNVSHIYKSSGQFTIAATATDEDGTWNANTVDVEVVQHAVPWVSGDPEIFEGREYTLNLNANNAKILQWEINWGDGKSEIVEGSLNKAAHVYADGDENFSINIIAVKEQNNVTKIIEIAKEILVRNVAPTLTISGESTSKPNDEYSLQLFNADPGDDTITSWEINWGDGTKSIVEGNPSQVKHIYKNAGNFKINAIATDEDGNWNANSINVLVRAAQIEWIKLIEDDRFLTEFRTTFNVPNSNRAIVLDIRNLQFDGQSENLINDAFEVALVDNDGTPLVATIKTTRDGYINVTENAGTTLASGVLYDSAAGRIILDLSNLETGISATLIVRLVNNDADTRTSVELNPVLSFIESPFANTSNTTPQENANLRQQIDFAHIQDITSNIKIEYEQTTFNDKQNILRAGLILTNISYREFRGPILVGIKNISDPSVSAVNYDGTTPDGIVYFDVSHFAFSGQDYTFTANEIIKGLDLQFLNPDRVQFTYDLIVFAHVNKAPKFVNESANTEITAGNEYIHLANAIDPEKDILRYEKVAGPEALIVNEKTGQITWETNESDIGVHAVMIRVYDSEGLYDEQIFTITVTKNINRPPYFTSTPETEAFFGSIYHYNANATDPDGDELIFKLISAFVTDTGVSLDAYHATHQIIVTPDGKVSWNPPVELIGKTITVILETNDNKGGTALQEYIIGVHADIANRPPIIVTEPSTHHVLQGEADESAGTVHPNAIDLELAAGEIANVVVEIDIAAVQTSIEVLPEGEPDKMVVYNETDAQKLLNMLLSGGTTGIKVNDIKLQGQSYNDNYYGDVVSTGYYVNNNETYGMGQYGIVLSSGNAADYGSGDSINEGNSFGYGNYQTEEQRGILSQITGKTNHYDVTQFDIYFDMLPGYDTLIFNLVFGSDEYPEYQRSSYIDGFGLLIDGENIAKYNELPINIDHPNMQYVVGTELDGILLNDPSDPQSGVLTFVKTFETGSTGHKLTFIVADASDNILDTTIFISNLGGTASQPMDIDVSPSKEDVNVKNTTGVNIGVNPGETAVFNVEVTGNGSSDYFDLQFTNQVTGEILGSIPVRVNNGHFYLLQAIDPDGDLITYSMPVAPEDATINSQTGAIKWNPNQTGSYTFTVRAEDGRGGVDEQTYTVNVTDSNAGNNTPIIEKIYDSEVAVGRNVSWQVQASDPEGDILSYHLIEPPSGMVIDHRTGKIDWSVPLDAASQIYEIKVLVTDQRGGKTTMEFAVNVSNYLISVNHAPSIMSVPLQFANVGNYYRTKIQATDPENDKLIFSLGDAPEGVFIDSNNGELFWLPTMEQLGWNSITVFVNDGYGCFNSLIFYVGVFDENQKPVINSCPITSPIVGKPWQYKLAANDADGDNLNYSIDPVSIKNGLNIDTKTGILSWTPEKIGQYEVIITVDDGRGGYENQAFILNVTENLVPPQITSTPKGPAFVGEKWCYEVTTDLIDGTYHLELDTISIARGITIEGNTISWTPDSVGEAAITIKLIDQNKIGVTQSFSIQAQAKAVAAYPPAITSEPFGPAYVGELWTYKIDASDPNNYAIKIYAVEDNGTLTPIEDGVLQWQPTATGTKRFTIRVENERGDWTEQSFTLSAVERVVQNLPPVITSIPTGHAQVGSKYQYQVDVYDPDGDVLVYSVDEISANVGVTIDRNGLLQWTPTVAGGQTIIVKINDNNGNVSTQKFELPVNPKPIISRPPEIKSKPAGPAYVGEKWSYSVNASDPEQDKITYWLVDANGEKAQIDGTIEWTPEEVGEKGFTIRAEDENGFFCEQSFLVNAMERQAQIDVPIISSVPTGPAYVDERYSYQVEAKTFDGSIPQVKIDEAALERGINIDANGYLTWIPDATGEFVIKIFVKDDSGNQSSQSFSLSVKARQVAEVQPTITSKPTGPAYVGETWKYQLNANTADGSSAIFYLVNADGEIMQEIAEGKLELLFDASCEQQIIIRAVDSKDSWSEQRFTLSVIGREVSGNEPPVITSIPIEQIRLENIYRYKINAFDPNGGKLTYKLDNAPIGASISSDGILTWNPTQIGQYDFSIIVSDGENEVVQSFTLNVLPPITTNTPPVITSILTSGAMKDREYVYQASASDIDGDKIEWSIDVSDIPEFARSDISIDKDTGKLTWTPRFAGQFTFKIIATDGRDSVAQIITLPVANNAPPVIAGLPTNADGQVGQEYVAQITADDPNGGKLTYKLENAPEGMIIDDDGIIKWSEPVAGQFNVTIIAADAEGAIARRQFSLQIIDPNIPNEPPQITNNPPSTIPVNKPFVFQLAATDPENDVVTFSLTNAPDGMTISSGGRIEWNPISEGQVSFSVKIDDGKNAVEYTFTIEVVAQRVNGQPVFTSTPPESVLVNKTLNYKPTAIDPDGDSVTFNLVNAPAGMTISQNNQNAEIIWTPTSALLGQKVSVTIRAIDAYGAISDQTFELAIRSVAQPPTITPSEIPLAVIEQPYTYQVKATDPQNEKLKYSISGETYGATIDKDTGQLTWTPQSEGVFAIQINVFNESGRGVAMTIPIQVFATAPNNKPYFTQLESQYVEIGKGWSFQVGAADWDNGDKLTYKLDGASVARGLIIDSTTGLVTWESPDGYIGQNVPVKVIVSDGKDEINGTFTLVLTGANVLPEIKNISDQVVTAGSKFLYDISAKDDNNDKLSYSIDEASRNLGIIIDSATGQLTWTPARDNIRNENYPVTVSVSDGRGDVVSKTFNIKVVEDTIAPNLNVSVSPAKTYAGQTVT